MLPCYRISSILLALCLLGGCVPESGPFEVVAFEQEGRGDVKLNEPLVFRFSGPVDPTSVDSTTVMIADDQGIPARGAWRTTGSEARFLPAHPSDAEYAGAGLRFGRRYRVVFAGYPMHGTVLSPGGSVLARRAVFGFSTIEQAAVRDLYGAFVDLSPAAGPRLLSVNGVPIEEIPYQGLEISAEDGFVLEFSEPLHPAAVLDGALRLHAPDEEGVPTGGAGVVPLICSFVSRSDNCGVRARPADPLERGRKYNLNSESILFRDFGGNGVEGDGFNFIQFRCRD